MKRRTVMLVPVLAALALAVLAPVRASEHESHPGYVDGSVFLKLAGEDTGTVEVSISGALLRALISFDPELKKIAAGLQSIHAVVLEMEGDGERLARARDEIVRTEKRLLREGWQRITKIRDGGDEVSVLVLSDEERIGGLVALVAGGDGELVFANIAGDIDLAAIARLGEKLDIPGLETLGDDE